MMRFPLSSTITYRISWSAVRISWTRMGGSPFQLHHQPRQRPMSRTLRTILQDLRYIVNNQGKREYFLSLKTMKAPLLSPLDNARFSLRFEKLLTENDAPSQAESSCQTKIYASENDLFPFSVPWIVTKETGNTGTEKLSGWTHPQLHSVYPLYRLLEDSLTKSYGGSWTHSVCLLDKPGREGFLVIEYQ